MTPGAVFGLIGTGLLAACASAPGIDRPVALDTAYAAREAGAMRPQDRCGPEFIQESLPGPVVTTIGPLIDGPFRPVCERHDACYRLQEQSQAWCDVRMRTEMVDICGVGRTSGSAGGALCRLRARLYFASVDNPVGAYAYEGEAGGRIAALDLAETARGRVKVCVTALNDTKLMQEYIVEVRDVAGRRLVRQPRLHERNIRSGDSAVICTRLSARQSRGRIEIRLVADRPDTMDVRNDKIVVDKRYVEPGARLTN